MNRRNTKRLRKWQDKWLMKFGKYPDYLAHCRQMSDPRPFPNNLPWIVR